MSEAELYERHVRRVYGFFMAKTFHTQTAEDLTSDVFVQSFEQFKHKANQIEDKEKYLYGVMKLVWLGYLRKKYANQEWVVEEVDDFSGFVDETIREIASQSLIDRALPYIQQLPEKQQAVLLLRFRDGRDLTEICQLLDKNMNYVKTTQKRGIASLKALVEGGVA